jgi:hypothetical protein
MAVTPYFRGGFLSKSVSISTVDEVYTRRFQLKPQNHRGCQPEISHKPPLTPSKRGYAQKTFKKPLNGDISNRIKIIFIYFRKNLILI